MWFECGEAARLYLSFRLLNLVCYKHAVHYFPFTTVCQGPHVAITTSRSCVVFMRSDDDVTCTVKHVYTYSGYIWLQLI